jgi:hypothetical protein
MEDSAAGDPNRPRPKRRFGAAVVLAGLSLLWLRALTGTGDPYAIVWFASACLVCLGGLAVAFGRALAYRGDTWQPAIVAAFASVLGPLSVGLLVLPPVWGSLREVPEQVRARHAVPEVAQLPDSTPPLPPDSPGPAPLVRTQTPEQAEAAHRRGTSLALGLAAATLAFASSILVGAWLTFASTTLTDGAWIALALFVVFVVGAVGFVGVLVAQRHERALARLEQVAALGMGAAIVLVAIDRGDLNWSDGNRVSVGFLYLLWGFVAFLFLWGAWSARKGTRE